MGTKRRFIREYKLEAVGLVTERGVSVAQAARDLGLHINSLRKWVREHQVDPHDALPEEGQQKPVAAEVTQLGREVAKLRMERDIPKESRGVLCQGGDVKCSFVVKHRATWRVLVLCDALGAPCSGLYA